VHGPGVTGPPAKYYIGAIDEKGAAQQLPVLRLRVCSPRRAVVVEMCVIVA
jgi:hypothetical protein